MYCQLLADDIYATGTLRSNRKLFPTDLIPAVKRGLPSRGDIEFRQDGNLAVIVWQETKAVIVVSTAHDPSATTTVRRKKGDGNVISVTCPNAIVDYNQHMGGVDWGDQYRKYYQVRMQSRKSYKYILFEVCILNSFILYRYSPCISKTLTYLEFRAELARQLIGHYCSRKRPGHPLSTATCIPPPKRILVAHFPSKTNKGRCQNCKKGWTVWFCSLGLSRKIWTPLKWSPWSLYWKYSELIFQRKC